MDDAQFQARKNQIETKYSVRLPNNMKTAIGVYREMQGSEDSQMNDAYFSAVTKLFGDCRGFSEELTRQSPNRKPLIII